MAALCYDGRTYSGGGCGGSVVNAEKGFLTGVGNSESSSAYLHGALGRVRKSTQTTAGVSHSFDNPSNPGQGYVYNAAGSLTGMWYPSGRQVSYGYDGAGRVSSAAGYVTGVSYHPHGAPYLTTLANGVVETAVYNDRLQAQWIEAMKSGSSLWKQENFYCPNQGGACTSNNGNVISQRLSVGGAQLVSTVYDMTPSAAWRRSTILRLRPISPIARRAS